ncbi:hypothetical protein, partial [Sphingobacterium shayense]|uniref:hypothetical protein n=1 Tax=Sphingobacterium shayense TaxID=626343 RepID=UPI001C131371
MQRKKSHINAVGLFIGFFCWAFSVCAQVTVTIPQANIINGSQLNSSVVVGNYSLGVSLLPTFSVKANTSSFLKSTGETIPLNR